MSDDEVLCGVCFEQLDKTNQENPVYKIPECGHEFCVNCLMQWWRAGNKSCPKCRDEGVASEYNFLCKSIIPSARQYARKKEAPNDLKKLVKKLSEKEKELREVKYKISENKNAVGVYKELKQTERKLYNQRWKKSFQVRALQKEIQLAYPIKPIVIVIRKEIEVNKDG